MDRSRADIYSEKSRKDLEKANASELRGYYANQASINPSLDPPPVPPTVAQVYTETAAKQGKFLAGMAISEYQGVLQNFFVGLVNAKRILEIGTFTGTSAIFFANALKRNGVKGGPDSQGSKPIICLDISEEYANIARQNFVKAGVEDYIDVVVGDARESVNNLDGQTFDVVFMDADKSSYINYYNTILEKKMISKNGLFIIDNTAFDCVTPYLGTPTPVADDAKLLDVPYGSQEGWGTVGKDLHEFNEYIRKDPRTEAVMLPIITGISFVRIVDLDY